MATEKENIIEMIKTLPEEERLFTHEEAKERLTKWLK